MGKTRTSEWENLGIEVRQHEPELYDRIVANLRELLDAKRIVRAHDDTLMLRQRRTLRKYSA